MKTKLPSERIREIAQQKQYEGNRTLTLVPAIIDYLDETYLASLEEQKKPKLLGYANRAIRISDAVYEIDLRGIL